MTTTNDVELAIITAVLSIYFITSTVMAVYIIKLVKKTQELAEKAESAVDTLESAAQDLKNISSSRFPFLGIIKKVVDLTTKDKQG